MNSLRKLLYFNLVSLLSFQINLVGEEIFSHSVKTEKKPWTSKSFLNDPSDFQFAIVSDRTGGVREGVFPRAVDKLNELRPEFVITVGDMIKGGAGNRDVGKLMGEWEEFNSFIKGFDMPFFYLPGNHDVGNEIADEIWDELYGVRYYSFVYKNVLFLCLNTQGGPGSKPALLEDEQIQWALHELRKNQQVRWTIVFMHQPLWLMEEGILIRKNGNKELRRTDTGWPRVARELKKRPHTVFAGHVHHYGKYLRNKTSFYTLGTTGGGSKLRGKAFGEFDHATWITMTDEGPRMANLLIDGIMKDDVTKESHQIFWRSLVFEEYFQKGSVLDGKELTLIIKNPFEFKIDGRLSWIQPTHKNVEVEPMNSNVSLLAGKEKILKFKLQGIGESKKRGFKSLPKLEVRFKSEGNSFDFEMLMDVPIEK